MWQSSGTLLISVGIRQVWNPVPLGSSKGALGRMQDACTGPALSQKWHRLRGRCRQQCWPFGPVDVAGALPLHQPSLPCGGSSTVSRCAKLGFHSVSTENGEPLVDLPRFLPSSLPAFLILHLFFPGRHSNAHERVSKKKGTYLPGKPSLSTRCMSYCITHTGLIPVSANHMEPPRVGGGETYFIHCGDQKQLQAGLTSQENVLWKGLKGLVVNTITLGFSNQCASFLFSLYFSSPPVNLFAVGTPQAHLHRKEI